MARKRTSNQFSIKTKREIWAMPCCICGTDYRVEADHIIPVTREGSGHRSNAQPLCALCNSKKRNRLSNEDLREWYEANKEAHHARIEARRNLHPQHT